MRDAVKADAYTGYHVGNRDRVWRIPPDVKQQSYNQITRDGIADKIERQYRKDRQDRQIANEWAKVLVAVTEMVRCLFYMAIGFGVGWILFHGF